MSINKTYLISELEKNPFVVCCDEDRILYLAEDAQSAKSFLELPGAKKYLKPGSMLAESENSLFQETLEQMLGPERNSNLNECLKKNRSIQIKANLVNLVNYFLTSYNSRYSQCSGIKQFSCNQISPAKISLNAENQKSVFSRKFGENAKFLFIVDDCYELIPLQDKKSNKCNPVNGQVTISGIIYGLAYRSTIKDFDASYLALLSEEAKKIIANSCAQEINAINKNLSGFEAFLDTELKTSKEGGLNKRVGYIQHKGNAYLYIGCQSYYTMTDPSTGIISGWFPPCKIGLKIDASEDKVWYGPGDASIIAPSRYVHCGLRSDNSICFSAEHSNIIFPERERKFDITEIPILCKHIKKALEGALTGLKTGKTSRLENGKTLKHSAVFHSSELKEYEKKGKLVGWADSMLQKEGIPKEWCKQGV